MTVCRSKWLLCQQMTLLPDIFCHHSPAQLNFPFPPTHAFCFHIFILFLTSHTHFYIFTFTHWPLQFHMFIFLILIFSFPLLLSSLLFSLSLFHFHVLYLYLYNFWEVSALNIFVMPSYLQFKKFFEVRRKSRKKFCGILTSYQRQQQHRLLQAINAELKTTYCGLTLHFEIKSTYQSLLHS